MSNIAQLELLIRKEQERGGELDKQMANEQRLLEEAEDKSAQLCKKYYTRNWQH